MPDVYISDKEKQALEINKENMLEESAKYLPLLSSYCENPNGVAFVSQEADEKILLFLRKHFIKNIYWLTLGFILLFVPILLTFPFNILQTLSNILPVSFIAVFLAFYYLIIIGYLYTNFITWFYNVGIITPKQIIDIDFTDIMYREVAKVRVQDVIDAEYTQGGFLHNFLNYGNVFIQTEGIKPNFEFHNIPNPDKTTDMIINLKGKSNA